MPWYLAALLAGRRHFVSAGNRPKRHSPGGGIPPGYIAESAETGYNHLKSRYYSPKVGRFLNVDSYVKTGQGLLDKNMFAYCGNNPVNRRDNNGDAWEDVKKWFSKRWNAFKNFVGNTWSADNQIENTDYIYYNISMIWPIVAVGALVGITNIPEYSGYPQLQPQPNN